MNTTSIKDINTEKIRNYMKYKQQASKSEIARETGLSFPTVTRIMDALCTTGELFDSGQGNSTGGRCASVYSINSRYSLCLLVQIEGKKVKWVIKDLEGNVVTLNQFMFVSGLLEQLDNLINTLEMDFPALKAIVIGIAAMVKGGTVEEATGFTDIKGVDIPLHFKNLTKIPVQIHNDANLIALGQWYQSKQKAKSTVSIYLGENGLGAGMIIDGEVWRGASDFAGELSYLPLYENTSVWLEENFHDIDVVDYYTKLIQIYTIVFNPEQVILYNNIYISDKIDNIRRNCYKYLPSKVVPHIEVSKNYQSDYEYGLYAKAEKMMS
jgi:predicted NBD/HSP70 family sugar kinase